MNIIDFTEDSPKLEESFAARSEKILADASRLYGAKVYAIPLNFEDSDGADNALDLLPNQDNAVGMIAGFIPSRERYEELYNAALKKGVRILNNPVQSTLAMEFDQFYPYIKDITPESVVIENIGDLDKAKKLGYPLFTKGAIKSLKEDGWKACVVDNDIDLEDRFIYFMKREFARNKMIARKVVNLRHTKFTAQGFPIGREYRTVWLNEQLVGYGYYWQHSDCKLALLISNEEIAMLTKAKEAVKRLNVPFLVVDVGQKEDFEWIVIETGDPQFSGMVQIPHFKFWTRFNEILGEQQS